MIEHALRTAEESLNMLSSLGHRFHLAEGPGPIHPQWPKKLFHIDSAPNGRMVADEHEAAELGPGWFDTLNAAQFSDGMDAQFTGRGGVKRGGLPAILHTWSLEELSQFTADAEAEKQRRIFEFKTQQKPSTET